MEFDALVKVIEEVLNVDPSEVTMETTFVDDLGADSLDIFQIIMGVQEALDIEDTDEFDAKMETVVTVGDAVEILKQAKQG